jgi:hypothetical protein
MYEFAGAGPCPFPGQLQYRVVNPRGAGVYFDKSFSSPVGPALRPGSIVCGTPRTDPSGMSSYVVELANGYASALDFEQLTSATPGPVLATGYYEYVGDEYVGDEYAGDGAPPIVPPTSPTVDCPPGMQWDAARGYCLPTATQPLPPAVHHAGYHDEFAGAGPCPFPGQLQYRVVNPRGAGVFFDKSFSSPVGPALRPGSIVCGTPRTDPSGMSSYVVELGNGYANALDFEQLTSAAPSPVLASGGYYAGDGVSSLGPRIMPATGCPVGTYWDDFHGKCTPVIPPPPQPVPLTSGYYAGVAQPQMPCGPGEYRDPHTNTCVPTIPMPPPQAPTFTGQGGDIPPDLYGADAIKKGCMPGTYWDGWYQKCVALGRPIAPPPDPFPPTIEEWRKLHRTGHYVGDARDVGMTLADIFSLGATAPAHAAMEAAKHFDEHHGEHWHEHHEHHDPHCHFVGAAEFVGAAVNEGVAAANNAALQAQSAQLAATHPDAKGTTAADSAQAATDHAEQAASHAQAAMTHPSPQGAVAHAQKAGAHAQQAALHAAKTHAACGNFEAVGSYYVGAAAGAQPPQHKAAAHAENATKQAASAHAAAQHPAAQKTPAAHEAAHAATAHAALAQKHAQATRSQPTARAAEHHARAAERHTQAAAAHAMRAHGEARRGLGRGREGFGRGHEGFGRGRGFGRGFGRARGFRDAYGRFHGRRFHGEWRGFGHPGWRHGIAERWRRHRAECFQWGEWACLTERIFDPMGNIAYRVTPAGEMEGIELSPEQQQANVIYVQATGEQPPSNDDGPLPGSDQSSSGAGAPADEDTDAGTADQDASAAQDTGVDQAADQADQATADANQATADAVATTNGDSGDTITQGDFTGWQMQFTDPYGYFNMATVPAWDSAYAYMPADYPPWYPMNWW